MSFLNKHFFGGVALGAGSVYLYEKNLQARNAALWRTAYRGHDDVGLAIKNKAHNFGEDVKSLAENAAQASKNAVVGAKDSTVEGASNIKKSIENNAVAAKNKVVGNADAAAKEAEKQSNSWFNWGGKKVDDAKDAAYDAKRDVEYKSKEFRNSARDAKDDAARAAEGKLTKLEREARKTESSWLGWGSKKADEASDSLDSANKDVQSRIGELKK